MRQQNATYESDSNNRNIDLESTVGKMSELPDPTKTVIGNIVDVNNGKVDKSNMMSTPIVAGHTLNEYYMAMGNTQVRMLFIPQNISDFVSSNQTGLVIIQKDSNTWGTILAISNGKLYISAYLGTTTRSAWSQIQ